ncbi:MAG TPA: hypothetical protein DEG76_06215 [Pseudohongiella sp.]|nr:hypothetical protein [Pseudohongiella sp.]|tara:strand:- start:591 stop:1424 length:834 start_codon:yes stop_codon:yes gene_type:complete
MLSHAKSQCAVLMALAVAVAGTSDAVAQAADEAAASLLETDSPASIGHTTAIALYYSRGKYGEDSSTRIRYMPVSHEIDGSNWRLKATAPMVEISGPGNILVNVGRVGDDSGGRVSERGVGDVLVSYTYELPAVSESLPFFDIGFELKLPTADEKRGLGTGKLDGTLQLDAYQLAGPMTLFATLAWKYRQASPVFQDLRNSWVVSAGLSYPLAENWQGGLIYDFRGAVSEFTGDTHELIPHLSWSPDPRWSIMMYLVEGFTNDSADLAIGTQLSVRW